MTHLNRHEVVMLLKRPNFADKCEHWRQQEVTNGVISEVRNDFLTFKRQDFLKSPRSLAFGLNVDWFQPYSTRGDVSVGVIYLVLLNLPREECFKWENVIPVGVIPEVETMPKSINPFLKPLVDEMQVLWKWIRLHSCLSHIPLVFCGAILLAISDIPAARKLCGFKGHSTERLAPNVLKASLGLSRLEGISLDLTENTGQDDVMTYTKDMHTW